MATTWVQLALLAVLSLVMVALGLFIVAWLIPTAVRDCLKQYRKTREQFTLQRRARESAQTLALAGGDLGIVTADGLSDVNESINQEIPWRNLERVEEDGAEYTYLDLSPGTGLILAKHGFDTPEEYERFKELAKECFDRAKQAEEQPQ